jgi:hypothetical protein
VIGKSYRVIEASTQILMEGLEGQVIYGRSESLQRSMCEAGRVKTKLHWRPQDVGDASNMEHLLRKATSNEYSQLRREEVWAETAEAMVGGLPKPVGTHIRTPASGEDAGHGAVAFGVFPAGFWSCFSFIWSGFLPPFLPFEMRMFTLCHFILELCNFLFDFVVGHS